MKGLALCLTFLITFFAMAHGHSAPPHMDLDMTSAEYEAILKKDNSTSTSKFSFRWWKKNDPTIEATIALGSRLSKWIGIVNDSRSAEQAIRLTSATTRPSHPLTKPNIYNPSIIEQKLQKALGAMPSEIKLILLGNSDLAANLPVDDETFIKHAREVDRLYQLAARYKSLIKYKREYIDASKRDVRGYHYLTSNQITSDQLRYLSTIPTQQLPLIKDALLGICLNSTGDAEDCETELKGALLMGKLDKFYNTHFKNAQTNWNSFFVIDKDHARTDVHWTADSLSVPFNTPDIPKFIPYLQNNIQEEFRWENWGLRIQFGSYRKGPRLVFEAGEVPHVNELGGNEIVMDSNQPIEEYESQWTIRHEFGHVLGLPDCYHEFFDENLNAFIQYQLDTTDLMCSRAGNMKERIYLELKRTYGN